MTDTNDSTGLLEAPDVSSRDQRKWTRLKPEETQTSLLLDDERIAAEIVDECYEGVGVLVNERLELQVDDPVELVYYGVPVRGVVRLVSQQGKQTKLGIQWSQRRREPSDVDRPRCRTESDFFLLGGIPVACRAIDQTGSKLLVCMPDGTEVEIAAEDIFAINRFQRLADLKPAADELRVLAAFYQLGALQSDDDVLRAVLNLEFASSWD
jgi:hypothetical protein